MSLSPMQSTPSSFNTINQNNLFNEKFSHPGFNSHPNVKYNKFGERLQAEDSNGILYNSLKNSGSGDFQSLQNYFDESSNSIEASASNDEEDIQFKLGTVIALLGMGGLILPLIAILSIPFDLMSPNLWMTKVLTLLTIPVGVLSYGRSLPINPLLEFLEKSLSQEMDHDELSSLEEPRGFFVINRFNSTVNKDFGNATKTPDSKPSKQEQCLERIACEGLLKSIPQLLIKSLLKGQEGMLRRFSFDFMKLFSRDLKQDVHNETIVSLIFQMYNQNFTPRRKDLAKLALKRIRNTAHHYLKQGSTNNINNIGSSSVSGSSTFNVVNSGLNNINQNNPGCFKYRCSLMF